MPASADAAPPMPTMELTAKRGTVSDTTVYRFAEKPWWAAAAMPIRIVAIQTFVTEAAANTGTTQSAHTSIAVFRAAFADHPRFNSHDESHPPAMLPIPAMR